MGEGFDICVVGDGFGGEGAANSLAPLAVFSAVNEVVGVPRSFFVECFTGIETNADELHT